MSLKRLTLCVAFLFLLGLGWAVTAPAKTYSLAAGSGAEFHIGNGLALPVQSAVAPCTTPPCTAFPPLLVGVAAQGKIISGTTTNTTGQKFTVPANALSRQAAQATVGVYDSNNALYAVATSLSFRWPAAPAVFSVSGGPRSTPNATVVFTGIVGGTTNKMRYSPRVAGKMFGGAARFVITPGPNSSTLNPSPFAGPNIAAPVTVYGLTPNAVAPPCAHTAFTKALGGIFGTGNGVASCAALAFAAYPSQTPNGGPAASPGVIGGPTLTTAATAGGPAPAPQGGAGVFGPGPLHSTAPKGTLSAFAFGTAAPGVTLAAQSTGNPWTTAMLTVSASKASPAEKFILSGNDFRNASGVGVVQMVAGSMSFRNVVGNNANRGWLRLNLQPFSKVPTMSPAALAATAGLMLLAAGYTLRKRLFA